MSKELFIIVDGNSFIHRAYHALPPLTNSTGFPTHAITGTLNMINALKNKFNPKHLVVAFDHKGKTFRNDMFVEYKANRSKTPEDLKVQFQPVKDIVEAWGLPQLCIEGVEADDSMVSLAIIAAEAGYQVIMATSDKDMRQGVNEDILMLDTKDVSSGGEPYGAEGVYERMGVYPDRVIDFLAFKGDSVDNVPGLDGCGDKTAIKWLDAYDTLEGVLENADNIGGKIGEKLRANFDTLRLSYQLVTIKTDVDCGRKPEEFIGSMDEEKLFELVNKYELNGFKKSLGLKDKNASEVSIDVISDESAVAEYVNSFLSNDLKYQSKHIRFFLETVDDKLLVSDTFNNKTYLIEPQNNTEFLNWLVETSNEKGSKIAAICSLDSKSVLKLMYSVTENRNVFQISVEDLRVYDYVNNGGQSKIQTVATLNDRFSKFQLSDLRTKYKLDDKSPKWNKMTFEEKVEVKSEELEISRFVFKENISYTDALLTDMSLLPILTMMECDGVLIDPSLLKEHGKALGKRIVDLGDKIHSIANESNDSEEKLSFNLASPKQVGEMLFDVMGIQTKKRSTAEDNLKKLAPDNPIIGMLFEWRSLSKLKSTYVDGLISRMDNENRLHTTFNQTIATTGRLTSTDPNLQNIPIKSEDGKVIRKAFTARKGYKVVALDYSQIELRILAHMSKDPKFVEAFNNGLDIHTATAAEVMGIPLKDVTPDGRRKAKATNFGMIYGMGYKKLAEELGISNQESKQFIDVYFEKYNIKPYFDEQLRKAKENLYTETYFGRKIPTPDVNSKNAFVKIHAELSAKNAGIQGTAAEIIKKAMIKIADPKENILSDDVRMLMQVHDELVFEIEESIADEMAIKIQSVMESVVEMDVPLLVDYKAADNYSHK